jgi:hypothetical protein
MIFEIICLVGLVFVVLTLPKALRRSGGVGGNANANNHVPPVINDVEPNLSFRQNTDVLAVDRVEYFELLEQHYADPLNIPPPIPPSKPHSYWGNEADVFGNNASSNEEFD